MEMVVKREQEGMYYYLKGMILENESKRQQAKEVFMNGLKRNPDYQPLQVALKHLNQVDSLKAQADSYFKSSNYTGAIKTYQ